MQNVQLPITYRVTMFFWIYWYGFTAFFSFLLFFSALQGETDRVYAVLVPCVMIPIGLLIGFLVRLRVTEEGFYYRNTFLNLSPAIINWSQVDKIFFVSKWIWSCSIVVDDKSKRQTAVIESSWIRLGKEDLKEFLRILKSKAPQANWESRVLQFMDEN